ncbi:homocysteine S-methyltransferase family protein [Methanococcoides sp. SA1]|nr:homocysteine S-methyltransferase family protein [Methanococcoides sp. SA1]
MSHFVILFNESKIILTEGALVERLKAEYNLKMDEAINHAGLIYTKPDILEQLYRQYIDIAVKYDLPIMIMTPTRRVNVESVKKSKYSDQNIISDSSDFLNSIKESYGHFSEKILIGGLLGCKGNAYSGEKIFTIDEAYNFHKQQTIQFTNKKVDYLFAGIMPEINEAIGMAKAMAETPLPYIISFMIQKEGCLLDGTNISDAIKIIDDGVDPKPVCYMTNCVHPTNLIKALNNDKNKTSPYLKRFNGLQANTSILSCDELDNCGELHQDDFNNIIDEMIYLEKQYGLKIFGGCCGTNQKFIDGLANELFSNSTTF